MPDAPPAAQGLRAVAERSAEFRQLVPRLARPDPADTWQADMLHYFLYELTREPDRAHSHALFVASWEQDTPVSVVLMGPDPMDPQARPAAA